MSFLAGRRPSGGFGFWCAALREEVAGFLWQLGDDQIVGFAEQAGEFVDGERVSVFEGDPLGAGQVRGGDDVGAFGQFGEIFWRGFEGEPDGGDFENRVGEHFVGYLEGEVTFPDGLFSGAGEA